MEEPDRDHPGVAGFHCGDEPWAVLIAENLKNGGAWEHHTSGKAAATIIYFADANEQTVAGYISIDARNIDLPSDPESKRTKGYIIANVGVSSKVQGQGYLRAMIDDIVEAATESGREGLMLLVDVRNVGARAMYERFGFKYFGPSHFEDGTEYLRMALSLRDGEYA